MDIQTILSDANTALVRCTDRTVNCLAWMRLLREGRPNNPEDLAAEIERTAGEVQRDLSGLYDGIRYEKISPNGPRQPEEGLVESLFGSLEALESAIGSPDQPWELSEEKLHAVKDLLIAARRKGVSLQARRVTRLNMDVTGLPSATVLAANKRGPHPISGPAAIGRQPFSTENVPSAEEGAAAIRRATLILEEYRKRNKRNDTPLPVERENSVPPPPPPAQGPQRTSGRVSSGVVGATRKRFEAEDAVRPPASAQVLAPDVPAAPGKSATIIRRKAFE